MSGTEVACPGVKQRIETATTALRRERRRTADELEALCAFEDRIRTTASVESQNGGRQTIGHLTAGATATTELNRIRDAYETTVMSVPHYIEEYDDTYVESLCEEFSPDLAAALTDGTAFSEWCKQALLSAVSESQSQRDWLLNALDAEHDSLEEARGELTTIAEELTDLEEQSFQTATFGALDAYRARLGTLESKCETTSETRQTELFEQRRENRFPDQIPDIAVYVYQELEETYPVLSVITDLIEWIQKLRSDVEKAMTYCHR